MSDQWERTRSEWRVEAEEVTLKIAPALEEAQAFADALVALQPDCRIYLVTNDFASNGSQTIVLKFERLRCWSPFSRRWEEIRDA